jgi:VWFA-related protein
LILLLAALIAPAAQQPSQVEETPTFRVGVNIVRVDAQVVDGGKLVTDLTTNDFLVTDEEAPQKIVYFGHEREPVSLLLLLDVSGSMQKSLSRMATKARQAMSHLQTGDRVAVMLFSARSRISEPFTENLAKIATDLDDAVKEQDLGGWTEINAAVLTAANYIKDEAETTGRRAILIVTDNSSMSYRLPDETVIRGLFAANTVLNAIVVGDGKRPKKPPSGKYLNPDFTPADVFTLAEETGGEAVKADKPDAVFQDMMERIRTRYSLHYHAPDAKPGTFRRIRVELTPAARSRYPNAVLRARAGYYAEK